MAGKGRRIGRKGRRDMKIKDPRGSVSLSCRWRGRPRYALVAILGFTLLLASSCSSFSASDSSGPDGSGASPQPGEGQVTAAPNATSGQVGTDGEGGDSPDGSNGQAFPSPGSYIYSVDLDGEADSETLKVHAAEVFEGYRLIRHELISDGGPPDSSFSLLLRWDSSGVYIHSLINKSRGSDESCVFGQPILMRKLPIEIGQDWESASECDGGDETVGFRLNVEVIKNEPVTIDGATFPTFVFSTDWVFTDNGIPAATKTEESWFAPSVGLEVKIRGEGEDRLFGSGKYEKTLRSTTPG